MSRTIPLLCLLLTSAASAQTAEPAIRTLPEAYRAALENSDAVAVSERTLRQAQALYRAAFGGSLPALTARHDTTWQDRRAGGAAGTQSDGMLRLSQTGLTGYGELAAVKTSKAAVGQREHERRRAEQFLLGDVASAYYGLLQAQDNTKTTAQLVEFADKRLAELKERVRVGRAREADALAQEVQSEALRSQLVESRRQVQARGDLLAFLVRAPVDPVAPSSSTLVSPSPLEEYLARVESRPDVAAARDAFEVAGGGVKLARADRFPQIGLQANYYGYRPEARSNNKWDAAASVSLPIFSFGAINASVDSAEAARERQGFVLRGTRRAADLEVRNAHRDYATAIRQLEIRRRAEALAQRDYRLQTQDERRGLVTAIEVLQSLDRLNIANLALNTALVDTRLAAITLETAAGALPEEILK